MAGTVRNIIFIVAIVVIGLIAINFISAIVPILIASLIAFIAGRLSARYDLFALAKRLFGLLRNTAPTAVADSATPATVVASAPKREASAAPTAHKPAPALEDEKPATRNDLLDTDFEIKTPEQIEAEARQREQDLLKKSATPSQDAVQAALEERRKRLLSGK